MLPPLPPREEINDSHDCKGLVIRKHRSYLVFEQPTNAVVFLVRSMLTVEGFFNIVHAMVHLFAEAYTAGKMLL